MQIECDKCHHWFMMGTPQITYYPVWNMYLCKQDQWFKCDYCDEEGFLGENINYCSQCGKFFCPQDQANLPKRAVNAFREKVMRRHTGRARQI